MTGAPSYVAVKRKRDDAPIQSLILEERRTKHARVNVEYRLESVSQLSNSQPQPGSNSNDQQTATRIPAAPAPSTNGAVKPSGPRHFELATPPPLTSKRTADAAGLLPTFIERPAKRTNLSSASPAPQPKAPLKRPGTRVATNGSAPRVLGKTAAPSAGLAAALEAFALEESARDASHDEEEQEHEPPQKPRVIVQPKRTVRRRKDIEASQPIEDDYVYDIYIRSAARSVPSPAPVPAPVTPFPQPQAPPLPTGPIDPSAPRTPSLLPLNPDTTAPRSLLESYASLTPSLTDAEQDVGYLILPTDPSSSAYFWTSSPSHSRRGSRSGSEDGEEDDEDSNAEDYYGADYPEDEVDEDDEMGVGEWRFRHGSDDEDDFATPGWGVREDGAGGDWSDSDMEEDRAMNPWKRFGGRT
ncbi:hypothetical protein K461DRAFT_319320 [Myriangium duriaei CBS 260.36]|uniref:Transcription factor Iwr1 domain-containing protein n=1 Tax=Myriangium duriaei CBS 260.36 TaxID=1168546 RepID=A0A9P4J9J9_9PEZI|nr:hypothetical protein K461DRAFT_319320 [Myriangium duriaei CBS 260.36]